MPKRIPAGDTAGDPATETVSDAAAPAGEQQASASPEVAETAAAPPAAEQPAEQTSPEERSAYVQAVVLKQGRLVGEERANGQAVPADQRAAFVAAVVQGAQAAVAAMTPEQLQAVYDAGREGRLVECRNLLGLS
jgi:hypothetical protein